MISPFERVVGVWAAVTGISLAFAFFSSYRQARYVYLLFLGLAGIVWAVGLLGGDRVSVPGWLPWIFLLAGLFAMARDSVRRYKETYRRITEEKRREREGR